MPVFSSSSKQAYSCYAYEACEASSVGSYSASDCYLKSVLATLVPYICDVVKICEILLCWDDWRDMSSRPSFDKHTSMVRAAFRLRLLPFFMVVWARLGVLSNYLVSSTVFGNFNPMVRSLADWDHVAFLRRPIEF